MVRFSLHSDFDLYSGDDEGYYSIFDSEEESYIGDFSKDDLSCVKDVLRKLNDLDFLLKDAERSLEISQKYRTVDNISLGEENQRLRKELEYNQGLYNLRLKTIVSFIDDLIYENTVLGKSNRLVDVKEMVLGLME